MEPYKQITVSGNYWKMYEVMEKLEVKGWKVFSLREAEAILRKGNKTLVLEIEE